MVATMSKIPGTAVAPDLLSAAVKITKEVLR